MNQFKNYIKKYFTFLYNYGYELAASIEENIQSFSGKNCKVEIMFNPIGYELTCQFVSNVGTAFSLQDGLSYLDIKEYKGLYQIGDKDDMEKGVIYISKAVEKVLKGIDLSDSAYFQEVYQFRINTRKELLNQYYVDTDLKKAETFWIEKKYESAKVLFEKNINSLSKSQMKKLEYIKKHTN